METYTTQQAAEITDIPIGTIRSWMSRCPGLFKQNIHFVIEESGRKMWTPTGIEFLKTRPTTLKSTEEPTNDDDSGTEADFSGFLEPILEAASNQLAYQFWRELPVRTLQRIQQMRTAPTVEERELMQQSVDDSLRIGTFELAPTYIRGLPNE